MRYIGILLCTLFLFSCSKSDDNGSKTYDEQLVGKWSLIKEERFNASSQLIATISLKAAEHCDYDQLDFLPSNTIDYNAYYLEEGSDECKSRFTKNAYRWTMLDHRRLALDSGDGRVDFVVTTVSDAELILTRPLTAMEKNTNESLKDVSFIKVFYQKAK